MIDLKYIDKNLTEINQERLGVSDWKSFAIKALSSLRTMVDKDQEYIKRLERMNDILLGQLGSTKEELEDVG